MSAGMFKPPGAFSVTPHKVSICILLQAYSPPPSPSPHLPISFPFSSSIQHNLLGLFLFSQTKSHSSFLEPPLHDFLQNLKQIPDLEHDHLIHLLTQTLSSLSSPDDLFNFFNTLRGILEGSVKDDYQILLDPSSSLGLFVRRCLLSFNSMSFEGVCHLLTNVDVYCKQLGYEDNKNDVFLRTHWQIQGYLAEQGDLIEKNGSFFVFNEFEGVLKQLQKLAPELHRVHFLRYLNSLYHDDYIAALEDLHRYFDYSAGMEGVECGDGVSGFGRYEIALLCLGMMQLVSGHPKQSLEVLTEAVRVSQQHGDDTYLAYTLAAICNLLFESGVSKTMGVIGSSYCPMESIGNSLSTQQQLYVLLRRSLKRAESLELKQLVASSHLSMAKFHMTHVQRPLLSLSPKASMKLRTCPVEVCKELRLTSLLIKEFGDESSGMTADGAFCTAWLKNINTSSGCLVFSPENASSGALDFCAQPSTVPASVTQLIGSSYLVRATSWEVYGSASLARMNALVFATCLSDSSSSADKALAYAKLIQHLAVFKGYEQAFSALKIAEERFLCVSKSRILLLKLQLLHERALHRGHLKLAQQLCDELGVLTSPVTGVDMDLKTQASVRYARTLLAANQFSQAASVAHSLFSWCYKYNLQVENAAVLLLLAEIHKRSGNAVLGIPYALASLSFCQSFNLDLLKASATLTLAELWLSLGPQHAKRALALVHSSLAKLLGHGGLELCARAFITEAKCYLAEPNLAVSEDPEIVLDSLRQASEGLELLEYHELASEAYYLMAVMCDKLGKFDDREKAAASFKNHMVALEDPVDDQDPLFNML